MSPGDETSGGCIIGRGRIVGHTDTDTDPAGGFVHGKGFRIDWQNGPLGRGNERQEPNGAFVEDKGTSFEHFSANLAANLRGLPLLFLGSVDGYHSTVHRVFGIDPVPFRQLQVSRKPGSSLL